MMDALQRGRLAWGFFGYGGCAFGASMAFNTEMTVLRMGVYYHFFTSFYRMNMRFEKELYFLSE